MSTLKGIIFYDSQQKFPFKQKEKTGSRVDHTGISLAKIEDNNF
jgi:hypothetical protein